MANGEVSEIPLLPISCTSPGYGATGQLQPSGQLSDASGQNGIATTAFSINGSSRSDPPAGRYTPEGDTIQRQLQETAHSAYDFVGGYVIRPALFAAFLSTRCMMESGSSLFLLEKCVELFLFFTKASLSDINESALMAANYFVMSFCIFYCGITRYRSIWKHCSVDDVRQLYLRKLTREVVRLKRKNRCLLIPFSILTGVAFAYYAANYMRGMVATQKFFELHGWPLSDVLAYGVPGVVTLASIMFNLPTSLFNAIEITMDPKRVIPLSFDRVGLSRLIGLAAVVAAGFNISIFLAEWGRRVGLAHETRLILEGVLGAATIINTLTTSGSALSPNEDQKERLGRAWKATRNSWLFCIPVLLTLHLIQLLLQVVGTLPSIGDLFTRLHYNNRIVDMVDHCSNHTGWSANMTTAECYDTVYGDVYHGLVIAEPLLCLVLGIPNLISYFAYLFPQASLGYEKLSEKTGMVCKATGEKLSEAWSCVSGNVSSLFCESKEKDDAYLFQRNEFVESTSIG